MNECGIFGRMVSTRHDYVALAADGWWHPLCGEGYVIERGRHNGSEYVIVQLRRRRRRSGRRKVLAFIDGRRVSWRVLHPTSASP